MPEITINVKCSNDQKYSVTIDTSKTVLEFKQAIAEKCDTTADRQRLIYSGRVLKDNDTLETYKIAEGHTVHMVKSSAPSGSSQAQASQQTQSATTGNTQTPQQPTGFSPNANPFAQFGAMGGFNQGTNPYGSPYGGMQNPLDLLQNPAIMQYMQQMLQDPQFVESMIHMNPQFSSMAPQIRQMMQDPDFQAMMSNPETFRSLAALQPLMGNLGPFTGGAIPGLPGYNTPATTGTNPTTNSTTNPTTNTTAGNTAGTTTTGSTPTSNTTTPSTTTPSINNNPFLPFFNPTAAGAAGTGTNPSQPPIMPLFDPLLWGALGGVPPTTTPTTTSASATSQTPQVPPEERFQSQLQQLNDMGFVDAQKNIRALQICQGNVNFAIERLLDPSF